MKTYVKNWITIGLLSALGLSVDAVWAKEYQLTGQYTQITLSDSGNQQSVTSFNITNPVTNDSITVNTLFEITLNSGQKLTDKDFHLDNLQQKDNQIYLNFSGHDIAIQTLLILNDDKHFASYEL